MIGNSCGQQLKALSVWLHDGLRLQHQQMHYLASLFAKCPNLEHLAIYQQYDDAHASQHQLLEMIIQHCPNLATLQIELELSESMIAELIRWRGSRPLLHLSCSNIEHIAARIRQHHKNAGTVNPWTVAGHCWCKEVLCVHRCKAQLM